jgi:MFS family permease
MIAVLRAYRLLLRNGPLARLLAGEFVSSIGDWLYLVAILILVYEVSQDPLVLGIVGAARVLPYVVLSIPAGILADRYDRRLILLVTDVARGALMLVMAASQRMRRSSRSSSSPSSRPASRRSSVPRSAHTCRRSWRTRSSWGPPTAPGPPSITLPL